MFINKEKYSETRLDSGPASTPQGVDLQLVNGFQPVASPDMDPDSSVLCDSQVSSNTNVNTNEKTILLEEIQDSGANKSLDSSVSFVEVSNISQNFTLNVGPTVSNLTAIQNVVPGGNPTLWLPTIITSSTTSTSTEEVLPLPEEPSNISQIILSGNGTHTHNTPQWQHQHQSANNNKYASASKVQILTIPKQASPSVPVSSIKTMVHTTYINQSDIKTKSPNLVGNNSILSSQMHPKNSSNTPVFGSALGQQQNFQAKAVASEMQVLNMPSSTSSGKHSNNNSLTQHQSHILSKVVPGPKLSSQSFGRAKNNLSQSRSKTSGRSGFQNILQPQGMQSPMSVKIIQQQNIPINNRSGVKSVPSSRSGVLTSKQRASTSNYNQANNHKQGTYSKSIPGSSIGKSISRNNIPQKLVVQQTPSRLMMSGNAGYNKGLIQYYQQASVDTSENVRYNSHQGYSNADSNFTPNSTSNQSLTAQILQTLSQPKLASSRIVSGHTNMSPLRFEAWEESDVYNQNKHIYGDPTTSRSSDDTLGIEERPNLPDDSLSYHYYSLQLVLLDHTYAVTPQPIPASVTSPAPAPVPSPVLPPVSVSVPLGNTAPTSCTTFKTLPSPTKSQSPKLAMSQSNNSFPSDNKYSFSNMPSRVMGEDPDDDAGSVMSSIDGEERREGERNGSDTETAPEGEGEEEGKTRCVCEFTHDDGYMICCDRCGEWQHVDCMGIDRQNIPDDYMCDQCQPRLIDRKRARSIQMRKKEEITNLYSSASASDSSTGMLGLHKKVASGRGAGLQKKQLLTVTTYSNTTSGVSRTVPLIPTHPHQQHQHQHHHQPSTYTAPYPTTGGPNTLNNKRGPKRTRRVDGARKGPKRKLPEKKIRRKSDVVKYKSKYGTNSSQQVNQWNDSYELAMTNHYSPELRAKIARYSSNKIGTNHNTMNSVLTAHFCTTVPHAGSKILIATKDMKDNSPIIELRGKYMLSTQHKPQPQPGSRAGSQRPGPYLFFYKFPKDPTQVCIDTRTYGNEARFVRRSCKPNAELQHCIIKGALHVYLVTISTIQSNTEITIRHESSTSYQPCACGNPKHCKQLSSTSSTDIVHKNNGATDNLILRERRGRTRHFSSSINPSTLPSIGSPHRKEGPMHKMDKRRKSEPETVASDLPLPDNNLKPLDIKPEPNLESDLEAINKMDIKEEFKVENISIKEEKEEKEIGQSVPSHEDSDKVDTSLVKVKIEKSSDEVDELEVPKTTPPLSMTPVHSPTSENVNKAKDTKINKQTSVGVRRTSTHSVRATRQSLSASNANESADEKSDSQTDCKMSAKEKKKMTREERKMEAIVKAIERMEKAEQRKLENKDKQIKRRESDPQQSCSVTSSSESNKDITQHMDMSEDNPSKVHTKGRPRRRGRSRTASQSKNATRMNSVDSDNMGTSEDEHHSSLMSPPRKCAIDNYMDTPPISSVDSQFQELTQTDEALKQSFDRIKYGLSSVCLLVEAAVAPLETTFKSPKTKKAIMNEWLNKSPESNMSYDIGSPEYGNSDNNNTNENIGQKGTYVGAKSTESLIKAASTMIGNLSGGIITADSTPEKNPTSDPSDNECSAKNTPETYLSPPSHSPLSYPSKNLKRLARDLSRDLAEKNRTPKKMRRVLRSLDSSPLKRSLRSGGGLRELDLESDKNIAEDNKVVHLESMEDVSNPIVTCVNKPLPPQHSAKKRWLRQAISEESDSPTAESPPSEMLTPLKKRRLARESLTSEPQTPVQAEEPFYPSIIHSSTKDSNTLSTSESKSPEGEKLQGDESNTRSQPLLDTSAVTDETSDKSEETSPVKCASLLNKCPLQEDLSESKVESFQKDERVLEEPQILPLYNQNECGEEKEEILDNNNVDKNTITEQNKVESTSNVHSNETSCNSSPLLDDMEDIQKKIHSFHTENIQILKIRNKKQPKEKRKKVNLNFDLSVLDNQTVEVKLKSDKDVLTENEQSKDEIAAVSEAITKPADIVSPEVGVVSESNPMEHCESNKEEVEETVAPEQTQDISTVQKDNEDVNDVALTNTFSSTGLFSETFRNNSKSSIIESISVTNDSSASVPDMNIIKNVLDMTVNLENSVFKDATLNTSDEYKNVEEILSRVNQMDSSNSVLLSGLMRDASFADDVLPPKVSQVPRIDPRLNPPLTDKPKPIRRKLSITEYRRRHSMVHPSESSSSPPPSTEPSNQSCLSEDEEDISQFEKKLEASLTKLDSIMSSMNMGVFNPQTTVQEKHRENLSERLRREFGLSIQEEDLSCSTSSTGVKSDNVSSEQEQKEEGISAGLSLSTLASEPLSPQVRLDG